MMMLVMTRSKCLVWARIFLEGPPRSVSSHNPRRDVAGDFRGHLSIKT
jgi:hypothetical protein